MPGISEITPQKGERALIIGGTRSGKSTLMDHFMRQIVSERPNVQILLLDTKPRFRTEAERFGYQNRLARSTEKRYADWESGPVIPYSMRVDIHRDKPLERFWRDDKYKKFRVAVAQSELPTERSKLLEIADDWYNVRQKRSDRVLAVDELLDHYHRNSLSIHSSRDVPLKVVRAGGERGFGALYGAQRPKGLPPQIAEELSVLYLFHLRYTGDIKYLWDMGMPTDINPPGEAEGDYAFHVIRIRPGGKCEFERTCRLVLDESYLSQLSDT
jgi:energy-coupling factor transporter ATP-binding protein EcfA2